MSHTFMKMINRLPGMARRPIRKMWYEYLSQMDKEANMLFMNYGWANLDHEKMLSLHKHDEPHRYCIQLYHHVVSGIDLNDQDVMEVGCGRGGGASYIMRYLKPRSLTGVDITSNAIRFCDQYYSHTGLSFLRGKAEALHFDDNAFDVIINIESSHVYASMEQFLQGVHRVLKPDGHFLFADFRLEEEMPTLKKQLSNSGLTLIKEERITPYIVRALELDDERKKQLIKQHVPKILRRFFNEFAGMKGTHSTYHRFKNGDMVYFNYAFRK